jgi:predicted metal-dependent hydrolase
MTAEHGSGDDARPLAGDHEGPSSHSGRGALFVGAALFDAQRHHAAHEVFEEAWNAARRAGRSSEALWWQGLVLCAGALHHRGNGNRTGEQALSARATDRLAAALADAASSYVSPAWWTLLAAAPAGADPRLGDLLDWTGEEQA